jgi:kynurenine formamidase
MFIDLSLKVGPENKSFKTRHLKINGKNESYTGVVYDFNHDSMLSTYIDFPGHVAHLDDGTDAGNLSIESLFNVKCAVIHLNKKTNSGEVNAEELSKAVSDIEDCRALIINALGNKRFDEIEKRSVWLSLDALDWIKSIGINLIISDIYESNDLSGVFPRLFEAGIMAVCCPVNLHLLPDKPIKVTALPLAFEKVTQLPCRLIAEI